MLRVLRAVVVARSRITGRKEEISLTGRSDNAMQHERDAGQHELGPLVTRVATFVYVAEADSIAP